MSEQSHATGAVFISYASQDARAAERICEALRAAGVAVWLDKSELRGGDAWDTQIKKRIHDCALFIPVISEHTNARGEGYFRGEWNLATRRLMNMAQDAPFVVPVVIDETREADARVPEEFLRAQWTWLPKGETPLAFTQRVHQLLDGDIAPVRSSETAAVRAIESGARKAAAVRPWSWFDSGGTRRARGIGVTIVALLLVLGGASFWYYQGANESSAPKFAPPPHSIAVLAFANMSGDPRDEYFSDGLSEELLNTLVRIDKLQVSARTSSFSFKGTSVDIPTVGRKLNVAAVLEGSVRKVGENVRITAQLIDAVTGYHLWSEHFDREFKDIIALQSEIAAAVADALEVRLLASEKKVREPGGTVNPKALDAFMRGRAGERIQDEKNLRAALVALDEAVALDPNYANAHALRADVLAQLSVVDLGDPAEVRRLSTEAVQSARLAVAIAPDSGFAHRELGMVLSFTTSDYGAADAAYRRAMQLEPGKADTLKDYATFAVLMGRADALPAVERARELDPLSKSVLANLGYVQYFSRRHEEARASLLQAMRGWDNQVTLDWLALNELALGNPAGALPYCERDVTTWSNQLCLAIAYHELGRQKEAEAMLQKLRDESGDAGACQYAQIYAQWDQPTEAIKWLEKALGAEDPGLISIKVDPLLDPLRKGKRFQEIVARLDFPP